MGARTGSHVSQPAARSVGSIGRGGANTISCGITKEQGSGAHRFSPKRVRLTLGKNRDGDLIKGGRTYCR